MFPHLQMVLHQNYTPQAPPSLTGGVGVGLQGDLFKSALILALDGSYAGKNLTLDGFEQSAATGGDVADLVLKTELVHASNAVAAADERECTLGS